MKSTYQTLLLVLLPAFVWAQQWDYMLFRPEVTYLYNNPLPGGGSQVLGIKAEGGPCDSTYFTLHTTPDDFCSKAYPAFVGYRICQSPGTTLLYSSLGMVADSPLTPFEIRIQTDAALGDTWLAVDDLNSDQYLLRVASMTLENILGLIDSVKTLQWLDTDFGILPGVPPIRISKQYGLLSSPYTCFLGTDNASVDLVGMSQPQVGLQNVTFERAFDQHPGDELHTFQQNTALLFDGFYHSYVYQRRILLENTPDAAARKVTQVWEVEEMKFYTGSAIPTEDTLYARFEDTLRLDFSPAEVFTDMTMLETLPGTGWLDFFPWANGITNIAMQAESYLDLPAKSLGAFNYASNDTCFSEPLDILPGDTYLERLGGPYYNTVGLGGYRVRVPLYYSLVDGSTGGTPLDFMVRTRNVAAKVANILAYPNPSNGIFNLDGLTGEHSVAVTVTNAQGQLVWQNLECKGTIDLRNLPNGSYIAKVRFESGNLSMCRLVKAGI